MNDRQPGRTEALRTRGTLRIGLVAATVSLAACGGGGGGETISLPASTSTLTPASAEFEVLSGGDACGSGGCGGDSAGGGGVGSGGDGGDGAGGGLGEMRNVRVTARKPDGTVLGSATLRSNLVSLRPKSYKGEFILEFADDGSGQGVYYDESKKAFVALSGQKLHVLVPALTHHVSANPLTEAAYQFAIGRYGSESALTGARMSEANAAVLATFNARAPAGYAITDITNYAVAVSDTTTSNTLPNTHAGRYGTLLAGLPRAASAHNPALPDPALAFLKQMVADVKDDGAVNNSAAVASAVEAYGADLSHALADGVTTAKADYGSPTQPAPLPAPSLCFSAAQFAIGSTQTTTSDMTDGAGVTTAMTMTATVTRRTTDFQGLDAIETKLEHTAGTTFLYHAPDVANGVTNYGTTSSFSTGSSLLVFTPPDVNRQFLLRPGETETRTLTSVQTIRDTSGTAIFGPTTISMQTSVTFTGFEDVTVPAGTFKGACKFVTVTDGTTTTNWVTASGQGVSVKTVTIGSSPFTSVLRSGTVNGQPVR